MNQNQSQELQIQQLQALLEREREKNRRAQEALTQLQSTHSAYQYPTAQASSSSPYNNPIAHNEFQLSNTAPATPFQYGGGMTRSHTVPRSAEAHHYHGTHAAVSSSPHQPEHHAHSVKRPRVMSQQAMPSQKLDRSTSNLSTRSDGPFMLNAPVSPPPKPRNSGFQAKSTGMMDFLDRDGPVNSSYAFTRSARPRHDMPPLRESGPATGVMMDPEEFFAAHPSFDDESMAMTGSFSTSMPSQPIDLEVPRFHVTDPSTCGSMTSGQTYDTTQMSRQNSQQLDNQSVSGGVQMMTLGSQMSHCADDIAYREGFSNPSSGDNSPLGKRPFPNDEALFAVGSSLGPPFPHQYPASTPADGLIASPEMERSVSNTSIASNRSTSSLKARAKDTLKQQVHRGLNAPLKPKPAVDPNAAESAANPKKDGKAAIVKQKYVRPKQPKVFCDQCDEHKEGFRGEHELRRHKDAKHQDMVKKFICVDPVSMGLPVGVPAVNPLSRCKACKAQKKYGAYYNAAAHLRRTHFKEKPSRQKNKNANSGRSDDDRRGGKGGGDWPPMSELKNWMREIWVHKHELNQGDDDEGDEDLNQSAPVVNMDINLTGMGEFASSELAIQNGGADDVLSNIDYMFPNNIVVNPAEVPYMNGMPLSSANFDFATSPNMSPPNFAPDFSAFASQEPMDQSYMTSAVSPTATITPHTAFNEPSHLPQVGLNTVYP
ncbi:hypothetical protein DL770_002192 [Monosporascus sp. CRB-9-2]|nr:hypothetical protein DL770_002192 [Monosporascus sp. CRB-9-2]